MRKWTAFFLALLMVFSLLPGACTLEVSAAETDTISLQETHINPLYADVISEKDLMTDRRPVLKADGGEIEYADTVEEAAVMMRESMKQRQDVFEVYLQTPFVSNDALVELAHQISDEAQIHTGVPTEGDYLMWQYGGWSVSISGQVADGIAYATYTYEVSYYTSAQQEAEVDAAVEQLLTDLNVSDASDEDKIRAVYDYICANVVYDYDHVEDTSYKTQYTAYGALIDGTSVCQGYAVLFYRLALELDVDARLIAGTGGSEAHGWNIVELGDYYYNVDSTWDAGETTYSYYLVCDHEFKNHNRYDEYATESFYEEYPMPYEGWVVTQEPTCEEDGIRSNACMVCDVVETETIDAVGHSYVSVVTEPTCTAEGYTTHTCDNCGESYTDNYTEKRPHEYINGKCAVCGAEGVARISGENRYETSLLIADALKQELGIDSFDAVVVASGTNFADALAGSYLANVKQAPILLAGGNAENLKDYIRENLNPGGVVYLLGGTSSVPETYETRLAEYEVIRLSGENRYETNLKILEEAGAAGQEILVCSGTGFADSLSASAVKKPILLVGKTLTADQKEFLESIGGQFTIIGGVNSVSAAVEEALSSFGTVERIGGDSRYETSVLVAERYFDAPAAAVVAGALNFPDGLCGGPLAGALNAPLILTAANNEAKAAAYVAEYGITRGIILGGSTMVSDKSIDIIFK